jgi:hypothetical protein
MTKTVSWASTAHSSRRARLLAAAALRAAGKGLDRLAWKLAAVQRRPVVAEPPTLEFHADAGAPEGALYVDGELVGRLPVSRL